MKKIIYVICSLCLLVNFCDAKQAKNYVPYSLFFWAGDTRLEKKEFKKLFALLDSTGYLKVFGSKKFWKTILSLETDFVSIIKALDQTGVWLILHSLKDFEAGIPSPQLFEAAANGHIIISDSHPFVVQEFGDSVLYLNDDLDGEALFNQINDHMKWIVSHPKEAELYAEKAHSIFVEKFS